MKEIKTEDAIGSVLCHDITEIVKDQRKGPRFKKGHIIKEEDIEVLLNLGKEHLYVFEKDETMMHENDAAEILCNLCFNEYMKKSAISEGKIELTSTIDGLFKVNREELFKVNSFGQMMIATRQGNVPVKKGDKLAGMRIIPLVIEKEKMQQIQEIVQKPILKIMPYQIKTAGIITTGSEVYKGRIKDTFTPVIVEKLKEYGVEVTYHSLSLDDHEMTTSKINEALKQGVDLVLCTGGMSVDPDDKTPLAIKNTGAKIISYGAPVLPGAMFLLSYYNGNIPIIGLYFSKLCTFERIKMTYKNPQKFDLKIRLYNQEKSFGKGVYELMKKTQSFGSLSGAYKAMKMSNSKAWKILKRAEEDLDMPLVERISGGKDGGGSKLTQEGEELLEKYEKFIQEMNEYAGVRFKEIFEDE